MNPGILSFVLFLTNASKLSLELFFLDPQSILSPLSRVDFISLRFELDSLLFLELCNLSLMGPSHFEDHLESITHISKFKMGSRPGACVLLIWIIIEVDPLVVHQLILWFIIA